MRAVPIVVVHHLASRASTLDAFGSTVAQNSSSTVWCALGRADDQIAATVIDSRKLIDSRTDLAAIHLNTVARHRPAMPLRPVTPAFPMRPGAEIMPDHDLVNGRGRQMQVVQPDQFNTEPLDPEPALSAQAEDKVLLVCPTSAPGECRGRRLSSRRPASPAASCRRNHLRSVGREMPNRRQTAPASPSLRQAPIHFCRRRTARATSFSLSFDDPAIAVVMVVGLWARRSVVHKLHGRPMLLKGCL